MMAQPPALSRLRVSLHCPARRHSPGCEPAGLTRVSQAIYVGVQGAVQEVGVQQEHRGGEVGIPLCSRKRGLTMQGRLTVGIPPTQSHDPRRVWGA